jgi:hypothetical protein
MVFYFGRIFPHSFMDDVTYVGDFEVRVQCMIRNILGLICYGSENFVSNSLRDDYVGFSGVTTHIL